MKASILNNQKGAALITALIFLVILTLVAVTSVQNVSLQEQMSSAVRQGNIALEMAETALREAETVLFGMNTPADFFTLGNGYYNRGLSPTDVWSLDWTSTQVVQATAITVNGVTYQPAYFVELIGPMSSNQINTGEILTGGALNPTIENLGYRVVARGVGNDGLTERVIEVYVARPF